jgi:transcriptional regulator with GAF, ATPase, and Fis domain
LADKSTIFLGEIGELPLDLQAKLLRGLQEGEFDPVCSSFTKKVSVRVLAATNRDLEKSVRDGKFREDLFYRLNVFPLRMPPLRERGDTCCGWPPLLRSGSPPRWAAPSCH